MPILKLLVPALFRFAITMAAELQVLGTSHRKLTLSHLYQLLPATTFSAQDIPLTSFNSEALLAMACLLEETRHVFARMLPDPVPSYFRYVIACTLILCSVIQAYRLVYQDYLAFLALGPGGTPGTFQGYLRVSRLRLYAHKDPFLPPALTPDILPSSGYLLRLPRRPGSRPRVAGIAPHRQTDQRPSQAIFEGVVGALHLLADAYPSWLRTGVSSFEKNGLALFLTSTVALQHPGATHLNETCRDTGEICHVHATVSFSSLPLHQWMAFAQFQVQRERPLR